MAQNHDKIVAFLLRYGTSCIIGKCMELLCIWAIILIAIFRDDPDLLIAQLVERWSSDPGYLDSNSSAAAELIGCVLNQDTNIHCFCPPRCVNGCL